MKRMIAILMILWGAIASHNEVIAAEISSSEVLRGEVLTEDGVLIVPKRVRSIPPYAYMGREDIREVRFEEGSECVKINDYAFAECINLQSIDLPPTLLAFGAGVFRECRSLKKLDIPLAIWFIPKEFLLRCVSLEEVNIPAGIQEIKAFGFAGCEKLRKLEIPAKLRVIENNAFSRCFKLKEIILPATVEKIESYAFSDCISLVRLQLSPSYNEIGELIVSGCTKLKELIVPAGRPPFIECQSYLFEPDDERAYERCRLIVPATAEKYYREYHGWRLFRHISVFD